VAAVTDVDIANDAMSSLQVAQTRLQVETPFAVS
jgi:hypothetical protein